MKTKMTAAMAIGNHLRGPVHSLTAQSSLSMALVLGTWPLASPVWPFTANWYWSPSNSTVMNQTGSRQYFMETSLSQVKPLS